MAIFTENDLDIYAPGLSLTDEQLTGQIAFIQKIIESPRGAGRPLEITEFEEKLRLYDNLSFYPNYTPLSEVTEVKVRSSGYVDSWGRSSVYEWRSLSEDDYQIESDSQIFIKRLTQYYPLYPNGCYNEVNIKYTAGFDFDSDSREVNGIKALVGQILTYINNSGSFKGVDEVQVPFDEVKIKYSTGTGAGNIPDSFLLPFRAYRPAKV